MDIKLLWTKNLPKEETFWTQDISGKIPETGILSSIELQVGGHFRLTSRSTSRFRA